MASCASCGQTILFGGLTDGPYRFCKEACRANSGALQIAAQIPDDVIEEQAREIHQGACPRCNRRGPVDIHTSHRIWSILFLTSWNSEPALCCRRCGVLGQSMSLVFCVLIGWWGIPWGIIMTPVQIVRNVVGLCSPPDPRRPSNELRDFVRLTIAANRAE